MAEYKGMNDAQLQIENHLYINNGKFVAVAYSNCDYFILGRVLRAEDGIFTITFLGKTDEKNDGFGLFA